MLPDPRRSDDRFRAFPAFNQAELTPYARQRHRLGTLADALFPEPHLLHRFARALGARRAMNLKELLESVEFHHRVRRRVRAPTVADLCCGHGLTGILFALYETQVERVLLVNDRRAPSVDLILEAAVEVGPWVADKVAFVEGSVEDVVLPPGAGVVAVHACGSLTDRVLDAALRAGGPVAVMPCCYSNARRQAVAGLRDALGTQLAVDIERTYRLEQAGVRVQWAAVPAAITPMNRVLIGVPR